MEKEKLVQKLLDEKFEEHDELFVGVKMRAKNNPSYFYDINNYHKDGFLSMEVLLNDLIDYLQSVKVK